MKAVIFNSGIGKRMGSLTEHCHKSMARLNSGETIFERQIRLLSECGIKDFVVTIGAHAQQLIDAAKNPQFADCRFSFVENAKYAQTNYIYSMYLAQKDIIGDDVMLLHGDLVFDKTLITELLFDSRDSLGCVNPSRPLPDKDFKARVVDGKIHEVSVNIFSPGCVAFQPLYKLSRENMLLWLAAVNVFVENGETGVYAENALNEIAPELEIEAFSYENFYVDEVDTPEDLERVSSEIRIFDFAEQEIISCHNTAEVIAGILRKNAAKKPMLVCGRSFDSQPSAGKITDALGEHVRFSDFSANPKYEDAVKATEIFKREGCDFLVSVGGGSAVDTAKNIKLFCALGQGDYLAQPFVFSPVKHLCVPTTAGSGSESTRFSVMYRDGEKQSLAHDTIIPEYVLLDPSMLATLPIYQKKSTLMDALCQAIESMWSVNSVQLSRDYAQRAIELLHGSYKGYFAGNPGAAKVVQEAANLAGKAINLTQTTAAHAMCYKLTTLFGIPHGHAVALCMDKLWRFMLENTSACCDPRGEEFIKEIFADIDSLFTLDDKRGSEAFSLLMQELELDIHPQATTSELENMVKSVNVDRLRNNPVALSTEDIHNIYKQIVIVKED